MFKRMFITFGVLVAAYAALVKWMPVPYDTGQHLQGSNRIKAEGYLYGEGPAPNDVIVGSSLAFRMVADSLPPGTYNLAVGGLSLQEGLDLIAKSGRWPKRVFVEANILFRKYDQGFMDKVSDPVMMTAREAMPMLREKNQPSGWLFGWLKQRAKEQVGAEGDANTELDGNTEIAGRFMLDEQLEHYKHIPGVDTVQQHMARLAASVAELERHGTQVVFFEMPIDTRLMEMPLAEASRALIAKHFTGKPFVQPDMANGYITTDGLHLRKESAARWSGDFRRMTEGALQ